MPAPFVQVGGATVNVKRFAPSTTPVKSKSGSRKRGKEKIVNGKLVTRKSVDVSRVSLIDNSKTSFTNLNPKARKLGAASRSKSLSKNKSTSQVSLANKHSKKILEKVKSRE